MKMLGMGAVSNYFTKNVNEAAAMTARPIDPPSFNIRMPLISSYV